MSSNPNARIGISLFLLSLGHFFVDLYSSALGAFQPLLVDKYGLTLTQAGLLGGAMAFSTSLTQPLYGILIDRMQTRMFAVLAPFVAGLFISSIGIAPSFAAIFAMVVAGGAGVAAFHPAGSSRATDGIRENKGRWMAVFISSGTLGVALGPSFFSTLIGRVGLDHTYWGALPGALVTLALFIWLPPKVRSAEAVRKALDWAPLRAIWRPLTIHFFLVFIRSIVQVTFVQMLPLYLHRVRGLSVQHASYTLTLYLTGGAIGGFVGGHLADRFGGRKVILISMLGSVPFLALFFLTTGLPSLIGLTLGGLFLLFTIPVNVVMAQALAPAQSGTVSALMMGFAWGASGIIFIPLTGWASDHFGMQLALGSLTVFPLLGFFLTLKLPKKA